MLAIATIDSSLRESLASSFRKNSIDFLVLREKEDIVKTVLQRHPSLVILDLYLSHPSGLEVLRQLRSGGFSGKVVVLGGPSTQTLASEASRLGAVQIVGRPFSTHQVLGAVRIAEAS